MYRTIQLAETIGPNGLICDGDWVESKDQDPNGDVRLIQLADIGDGVYLNKSGRFLTSDKAKELKCTFLKPGDVLVSRMADPIGRACIFPGNTRLCVTVVDVCVARPDESIVLADWLKYAINSPRFRGTVSSRAVGATRTRISRKNLQSIEVAVPPLAEQRRVVDILSRAEGIVRLRREAQKKAAEIIPTLFLDMFGDPATNPKGWAHVTLAEVGDVQGGLQVTTARGILPLELPYLRVANVYRTHIDLSEVKRIRLSHAEYKRVRLERGDLLVVEGHGNPAEIGRVGIWDGSIAECVHQNHLIRVRCRLEKSIPEFVWAFFNSVGGRQQLLQKGKTTSGLNTISTSNVKACQLMAAALQRQREFAARIEEIRSIQSQQSAATAKAEAAFDALLARVFSPASAGNTAARVGSGDVRNPNVTASS